MYIYIFFYIYLYYIYNIIYLNLSGVITKKATKSMVNNNDKKEKSDVSCIMVETQLYIVYSVSNVQEII